MLLRFSNREHQRVHWDAAWHAGKYIQAQAPDVELDIQRHFQSGRVRWWAPVMMLAARPVFALLPQLAVAAGFRLQRHPKPLQEVGRWWMVSGTLIDLLSLGMLTWLNRGEGLRITDLLDVRHILSFCIPKSRACILT